MLPSVILLETVTACTRRCSFCSWGQPRPIADAGERMPMELIESICQQLSSDYDGRVSPFLTNEPLLDVRLPEIVQLIRSLCPRATITIATNGDLLTHKLALKLFECGLTGIGVSVYEELKQDWLLDKHGLPITLLNRRNPSSFVENRGGNIPGHQPKNSPCYRPSSMLPVKANGDVILCCGDLYGDVVMGNLQETPLLDIWLGQKFTDYRERLLKERSGLFPCENCSHRGTASPVSWPMPGTMIKKPEDFVSVSN